MCALHGVDDSVRQASLGGPPQKPGLEGTPFPWGHQNCSPHLQQCRWVVRDWLSVPDPHLHHRNKSTSVCPNCDQMRVTTEERSLHFSALGPPLRKSSPLLKGSGMCRARKECRCVSPHNHISEAAPNLLAIEICHRPSAARRDNHVLGLVTQGQNGDENS